MIAHKKLPTGISGLDVVLEGGLPSGRGILLIGGPGTGKTILLTQFLYEGITKLNDKGVFLTFEEKTEDIIENAKSFDWDLEKLILQKKLIFVDSSPTLNCEEISTCYDLQPILDRLNYAVNKIKANKVVIDGLGNLFCKFSNHKLVRDIIYNISAELKKQNIIFMMSTEKSQLPGMFNAEEYVSDGVAELSRDTNQNLSSRYLEIIKIRGTSYKMGKSSFDIDNTGIHIYPEFVVKKEIVQPKLSLKCEFDIPDLDKSLDGGLPRGSNTVIVGETGTGKTTLSMSFLVNGLKKNENALYISFKDSQETIEMTLKHSKWEIDKFINNKKLIFLCPKENPDRLIYTIITLIKNMNIKRVVIDSVLFADPLVRYNEKIVQFYLNILLWFKENGITCLLIYLNLDNELSSHNPVSLSLRRVLSAVPDGIILLRLNLKEDSVEKKLGIIKLKGSNHSTKIYKYVNDDEGFRFVDSELTKSN